MEIRFDSADSPSRRGNIPRDGQKRWTLLFQLSDGNELYLTIGETTHDAFISMLNEESIDDTIDEVIQHGASQNDN